MKRQAAILGPTPEFVVWSIRHSCVIREETELSSPSATERALRTLREAQFALTEGRVMDGLAYQFFSNGQTDEDRDTPDLGVFFLDDAFIPFGGQRAVQNACGSCPANISAADRIEIAACFGTIAKPDCGDDQQIEAALEYVKDRTELATIVPLTGSSWYGLWRAPIWNDVPLPQLLQLFAALTEQLDSPPPLQGLVLAIQRCIDQSLTIDILSCPSGFSDGLHWIWNSHCGNCNYPQAVGQAICPVCQRQGTPVTGKKRKVRGRRPFVAIESLLDPQTAAKIRKSIEERFNH